MAKIGNMVKKIPPKAVNLIVYEYVTMGRIAKIGSQNPRRSRGKF